VRRRRLEKLNPRLREARERNEREALAKMQDLEAQAPVDVVSILRDKSQSETRRADAAFVLGVTRLRAATEALIEALAEGQSGLSNACAHALGEIQSRRGARKLMRIVRGNYPSAARRDALYALWLLREKRAETLFIRISGALGTEDDFMRDMATEALGIANRRVLTQRAIRDRLFDPNVSVRYSALCACQGIALDGFSQFLREALIAKLSDPDKVNDDEVIAKLAAELLRGPLQ